MKRLLKRLSFLLCITPTITFAECIDVPYLGTYCSPPNGGIINAPYLGPQCGYGQCIQVPYLGVQCSNVSGGGAVYKPYVGAQCQGECVSGDSNLCQKL